MKTPRDKQAVRMKIRSGRIFPVLNYGLFFCVNLIMLYPFWHTLVGSVVEYKEYLETSVFLFPKTFTLESYRLIFRAGVIFAPMVNTILVTLIGTLFSLTVTAFTAYALSKRFVGSKVIMYFIVFTMFFHGGLIPNYILYRKLGLINNFWVLILPAVISNYNLIVMRTHFSGFPKELEDAAKIDGCRELGTFVRIVLPLSKEILATIGLFFAVSYWNTFFPSLFFITDPARKSLQDYLYRIVSASDPQELGLYQSVRVFVGSVKMAAIILVITPILLVYPFVQKYFVKGAMVGAVKG